MAGIAAQIVIHQDEQDILRKILRSKTLGVALQERAQIVLAASENLTNLQIQAQFGLEEHRVAFWRTRFRDEYDLWRQLDPNLRPPMSEKLLSQWLADRKGRGRKPTITPEQKALILAVALEPPSKSGYPHTHWTSRLLAQEVIKRGIIDYIAFQTVWDFLKDKRPETAQKPVLPEVRRQRKRPGKV
jgi:hypothetical protein